MKMGDVFPRKNAKILADGKAKNSWGKRGGLRNPGSGQKKTAPFARAGERGRNKAFPQKRARRGVLG